MEEFKELPPKVVENAKLGLSTLLELAKPGQDISTQRILDAVENCPNTSLAISILFAAAEWAEKQEDEDTNRWAYAFDWMRHTLMCNDVSQLPQMVYTMQELEHGRYGEAREFANQSGGLNAEYDAVESWWK